MVRAILLARTADTDLAHVRQYTIGGRTELFETYTELFAILRRLRSELASLKGPRLSRRLFSGGSKVRRRRAF